MDDRNAWRRERIVYLLQEHSAPFDKAETLRMASDAVVADLRDMEEKSIGSVTEPTTASESSSPLLEDGAWPAHLEPGLPYEYLGNSPAARKEREEAKAFMSPQQLAELEPPSDAALAAAREKLRAVANPVGRMLVASGACLPTIPGGAARFTVEAATVAAKVCLAVRLFFDRFGRAPAELSELAAAGLLRETPIDPFDRRPLRYSRQRGLIWSVGMDGNDGHGDPSGDLVWRVPLAGGS